MSDRVNSTSSSRAFIESDRVEGTALHDFAVKPLGTIKRLIIEKTSGRVAYVVISFGGLTFLTGAAILIGISAAAALVL